jgi:iron complex transport system ATP-binding protein
MTHPLFEARNLSVNLGTRRVVAEANVSLAAGELVLLVGPNGAGKTTLIKAMAGLIPADGTIALGGEDLASMPARLRARRLAYLPQGHDFSWPLPVADIVALGRHPHADPFAQVSAEDRAAVSQALEATGVMAFADRPVTMLSGGERARVALARVLATQAQVVLADEPTMSLDPRHQFVVMDLLRKVARAGGAVLAVVHDLALAARYADRVLVLDRGRIVAEGPPDMALSADRIAETFGVAADVVALGAVAVPIVRGPL